MKKRAILFAGGVDFYRNYSRYENDLRLAYTVLLEKLNYSSDDISIFLGYGKSMAYNDQMIKTQIAYKNILIDKLNSISNELEEEDSLIIVVSNHGSKGPYINMWGMECLSLDEFEESLKKIKANKLLIMGQCYGGNFLNMDVDHTCIITANRPDQVSYARLPNREYDEFLYLFFSFLYGKYPDSSCKITETEQNIKKAYSFAYENDQYNPKGICRNTQHLDYIESPAIKNNIEDLNVFIY